MPIRPPPTAPAATDRLTLDAVMARLAAHAAVDGVAILGSGGRGTLTPGSDYDLLVVLAPMPVPLRIGLTSVDGRIADLLFADGATLDRLAAGPAPVAGASWDGWLLRALPGARIAYDRGGRLAAAQAAARPARLAAPPAGEKYRTWFSVNYTVAQNRRLLASGDPLAGAALDIRLLYSLFDVLTAYFRLRDVAWPGEKEAIRTLAADDPDFLARFQAALAAPDRARKEAHYEALAALALVPLGGLWPPAVTAMQVEPGDADPLATATAALACWARLLGADPGAEATHG